MTSALRAAVEAALLKVARNVSKHHFKNGGWHEGDECFVVDLREAQRELEEILEREILLAGLQRAMVSNERDFGRHVPIRTI